MNREKKEVQSLEKENTGSFFRGKWKVMSGEAELCVCVVTTELLLSKGTLTWKESNGPCIVTCNQGSMLSNCSQDQTPQSGQVEEHLQ